MIQLGYYPPQQQDESMDFEDPNYDPSDFLLKKPATASAASASQEQIPITQTHQQYQESFDFSAEIQEGAGGDEIQMQQNYFSSYGTQQQQAFNVGDYSFQQQSMMQEDFSQSQQQLQPNLANDGGGLADLEISDSDSDSMDDVNISENPADTSKDDGGLWF
jgi:hypothetical protein